MIEIKKFLFQYARGNNSLQLTIKKKDYGDMTLYDIFFKDLFLFTISQKGELLLSNWECARKGPVYLDDDVIDKLNAFIETVKV